MKKKVLLRRKIQLHLRMLMNKLGLRNKKIFAIGYNKTATSSMHELFFSLGLPSFHGGGWRMENENEDRVLLAYDCFTDGIPKYLPEEFPKLDEKYPNAKFILQVRNLDDWVYSRLAHIERLTINENYKTKPGWDVSESSVLSWIQLRNNHHLSVLSYFRDRPQDLIVLNLTKNEQAGTVLANALGYQGVYKLSKLNRNPNHVVPPHHTEMFNNCLASLQIPEREKTNDIFCPSLAVDNISTRNYPNDTKDIRYS